MPAYLKGWRVFGNNVFVSLWGVKVTISEIERKEFIRQSSRLAAEGGSGGISGFMFHKAKSAGKCFTT